MTATTTTTIMMLDNNKTQCITRGFQQKRLAFAMASHPRVLSRSSTIHVLARHTDIMSYIFSIAELSVMTNFQTMHIHIQRVFRYKHRNAIEQAYHSLFSRIFFNSNPLPYLTPLVLQSPPLSQQQQQQQQQNSTLEIDTPYIRKTAMDAIIRLVSSMMLILPTKVVTHYIWNNKALFLHCETQDSSFPSSTTTTTTTTFLVPHTAAIFSQIEIDICHLPIQTLLRTLFELAFNSNSFRSYLLKAAYHRRWNFPLLTLDKHREWDSYVRLLIIQWGRRLLLLHPHPQQKNSTHTHTHTSINTLY